MSVLKQPRLESEGARIRRLSGVFGDIWAIVCAFTEDSATIAYLEDNGFTDGKVYRWAEEVGGLRIRWENGWVRHLKRDPSETGPAQLRYDLLYMHNHVFTTRPLGVLRSAIEEAYLYRGVCHRDEDEPAVITEDGKHWCRKGMLHRDGDKPACVYNDGVRVWFKDGQEHREADRPAFVSDTGAKRWFWKGRMHRDNDRPARVSPDGTCEWFRHGKLHRDNGLPAVIRADGTEAYFTHGHPRVQ